MRTVFSLIALCLMAAAQTQQPAYIAFREATLSGAGEVVTIQQPASPSRTVVFDGLAVYCSAACTFTLERDGSAATGTAFTPNAVASNTEPVTALAFHTSNASAGTVLGKYEVAAGDTMSIETKGMRLARVAGRNASIRVASMTGTVRVYMKWTEVL